MAMSKTNSNSELVSKVLFSVDVSLLHAIAAHVNTSFCYSSPHGTLTFSTRKHVYLEAKIIFNTHNQMQTAPLVYMFTTHTNTLCSTASINNKPSTHFSATQNNIVCENGFSWTKVSSSETRDTTWQRTCHESNTSVHLS
jgi:hypothetical protein